MRRPTFASPRALRPRRRDRGPVLAGPRPRLRMRYSPASAASPPCGGSERARLVCSASALKGWRGFPATVLAERRRLRPLQRSAHPEREGEAGPGEQHGPLPVTPPQPQDPRHTGRDEGLLGEEGQRSHNTSEREGDGAAGPAGQHGDGPGRRYPRRSSL